MLEISDEQVELIHDRIVNDGITNYDLQNGLLDHYCCFIEEQLSEGVDFETAFDNAFVAISPNGMQEIQQELHILLTFRSQIIMKTIIYCSGFLAAFGLSTGLMFKGMHWPGSLTLMLLGAIFLVVTALAVLFNFIKDRKKTRKPLQNFMVMLGFTSAILISCGSVMRMYYFQGSYLPLLFGMVLLNFFILPALFYYLYQQSKQRIS